MAEIAKAFVEAEAAEAVSSPSRKLRIADTISRSSGDDICAGSASKSCLGKHPATKILTAVLHFFVRHGRQTASK